MWHVYIYSLDACAKTINMNKLISVNDEIESVSLYTLRPLLLHGYVLPFVLLYGGWLYVWLAVLGFSDYVEAGCIGIVIIGLLQVVCSLLCHWFVSVRCLLTCNRVRLVFYYCLCDDLLTEVSIHRASPVHALHAAFRPLYVLLKSKLTNADILSYSVPAGTN